jgi:hypothetical protein
VSFPHGWKDYLLAKHGELPYDPAEFLLRVNRNVYGATDAGKLWFELLSEFLLDELV